MRGAVPGVEFDDGSMYSGDASDIEGNRWELPQQPTPGDLEGHRGDGHECGAPAHDLERKKKSFV
jgi:hypothetical protein